MAVNTLPPGAAHHARDFGTFSHNERRVLGLVVRNTRITQAAIRHEMELTQQAVSRIVNGLIERGILRSGERVSDGRRGQPSPRLTVVPEFAYSFGVAIMADAVAVGLMDLSGNLLDTRLQGLTPMTRDNVLDAVQAMMTQQVAAHGVDADRVFGIGVGVSGYFVDNSPRFNTPAMLPDWALANVPEIVEQRFGLPVWAANDGTAAAVGESMVGVGRWARNFAYLYFSAGFGGGIIVDGQLLRGDHGNAGECAGILPYNIYTHPNLEFLRQLVTKHGVALETVHDLVEKFDPQWTGVDEWIAKVPDSLSLVCSAISAILDTTVIVLGGRMPRALAERVIPQIEFYSMARRGLPRPVPKVVAAETDGDATLIGAASLPFTKHFF